MIKNSEPKTHPKVQIKRAELEMHPKVKVEMTDERNETIHLFDYNITRFASIFVNVLVYFYIH